MSGQASGWSKTKDRCPDCGSLIERQTITSGYLQTKTTDTDVYRRCSSLDCDNHYRENFA